MYTVKNNSFNLFFTGYAPAIPHQFSLLLDRIFSTEEFNKTDNKIQFVLDVLEANNVHDRPTDQAIRQFVYVRNLTSHLVEIVVEDFKPTKMFKSCISEQTDLYVLDEVQSVDKNVGFELIELFEDVEDDLNKSDPQLIPVPNLLDDYDELERYWI